MKPGPKPQQVMKRFWPKVDVRGPEECWPWTGSRKNGYGEMAEGYAHRILFEHVHGYAPEVVRHSCDRPSCVNPRHLLGGTHADNMQDSIVRERRGYKNAVREEALSLVQRGVSQTEAGRRLGVHGSTVSLWVKAQRNEH